MCRSGAAGQGQRKVLPVAEGHIAASTPRNACEVYPKQAAYFWAPLTADGQRQARTASAVRASKRGALRGGHVARNVSFHDMTSGPSYAGHMDAGCNANCIHVSPPLMPFLLFLMIPHEKRQTCRSLPRQAAKNGNIIFHTYCVGTIQYLWNIFHTVENAPF